MKNGMFNYRLKNKRVEMKDTEKWDRVNYCLNVVKTKKFCLKSCFVYNYKHK